MKSYWLLAAIAAFPTPALADIYYTCDTGDGGADLFTVDAQRNSVVQWDGEANWVPLCSYIGSQFGDIVQSCSEKVHADESAGISFTMVPPDGTATRQLELFINRKLRRLEMKGEGKIENINQCTMFPGERSMEKFNMLTEPSPPAGTKVTIDNATPYPLRCNVELRGKSDTLGTSRDVTLSTVLTVGRNSRNSQSWANVVPATAQVTSSCEITD